MTSSSGKELDLGQQIKFLNKIQFFSTFDDHEIRQFLAVSKWLKVPKGTTIIKEGAVERVFYILVKGRVSVFKTMDAANTIELTTLSTGDCFGEMALVGETKRTAGVKTSTDSFILMVEPDIISTSNVFLQLKFYKRFCEILVARLVLANQRVTSPGSTPEPQPAATPPKTEAPAEKKITPPAEKTAGGKLPPQPRLIGRISPTKLQRRLQPDQFMLINPEPAEQLSRLLTSNGDNTRSMAELLALDPILSAKILQTANSPFFRRSCPVTSVPHAMIIVGIQHVQKVVEEAIEASQELVLFSGFDELRRRFWRHAVVVARIAQLLKDIIRINTATDIYLAGLLHDLGKLGIDSLEPAFYPQFLKPDSIFTKDRLRKESEYVGTDHTWAGLWVGEHLSLPQVYLDVMLHHHTPEKATGDSILPTALVHLADIFATQHGVCLSGPDSETIAPLESTAWAQIQEQHHSFTEVNVFDFITSFDAELTNTWSDITAGLT